MDEGRLLKENISYEVYDVKNEQLVALKLIFFCNQSVIAKIVRNNK